MRVKMRWVALLLAAIVVGSLGITALIYTETEQAGTFSVTAATYPLYTAALNVVGDTAGVTVSCLIQPTAGCAHDYQLSPAEMRRLSTARVVVRGGDDAFLNGALATLPEVVQIDTLQGISLLSACEGEHHHHDHEYNYHSFVSPARYAKQVENLRDGLCAADPQNAAAYTRNAAAYLQKIRNLQARLTALPVDGAVVLHDSVAYVAEAVGLPVLATLPLGEESGVSAADLAEAAEAVQGKRVVLIYDSQFAEQEFSLDTYAAYAVTVIWDTAVLPRDGVAPENAWLYAMEQNLKAWEAAV